jgi:uncharacterized membrane protein YozB (DUF420 family)
VNRGFLRTAAAFTVDLTLAVELAMGLTLVLGIVLARRGYYRAHAWCQSSVVLMNLVVIALIMAPSFRRSFTPPFPTGLRNSYYVLATLHAGLGTISELLGLYILIVAGTNILPKRLRFTGYKLWMRTALALWWLVLLLGVATYVRWYVAPLLSQ